VIPLVIWGGFNYFALGDFTGTHSHIEYCGWQIKPFNQIWHHPIFTLKGFYYFSSNLIVSFWRGEFVWHFQGVHSKNADILYIITSAVFGLFGTISLLFEKDSILPWQRLCNRLLVVTPLLFVAFLVFLSMRYDFGNDYYPSRRYPFFNSGRLILASFIPFLVIYIKGIEFISAKVRIAIDPIIILLLIGIYSLYTEITVTYYLGLFANPLNFFHI
jgi:hypothetical protein